MKVGEKYFQSNIARYRRCQYSQESQPSYDNVVLLILELAHPSFLRKKKQCVGTCIVFKNVYEQVMYLCRKVEN